ncbi:hypothetical protein SHI21_03475 [Bacteriovorax sp. PP10]|uniref:Uncharacterized protein n=1 Tax=Bacteriovorax antarcticus TaxID=3088717 RepID=A0ABU5VQN3_9BACT|nr:hypothetical protein [Bacteriovorax sp. PP10]MEA9355242.1 hypothetical protein [Bacteriovorax sp. PP10]
MEGSGRGRIELQTTKYTFTYESQFDRRGNKFDLVLDFPVVGEKALYISLDPEEMNRTIKSSEITEMLNQQLEGNPNKKRIAKAVEEFFVFASDFMRFKAAKTYPKHYSSSFVDGHFVLERNTNSYRFAVDNFSSNENFYERTVFKIFIKDLSPNAILTLFLVPQSCEK